MNFFSLFKRKFLYKIRKKIDIDKDNFSNKNLDELFYYYGSDKAEINKKNLDKGHGFSKFYTKNLDHLKDKKINILEIGSFSGASAAAFKKYFFNSTIYCFDINISNFIFKSNNIQVFGVDIKNSIEVKSLLRKINKDKGLEFFDIIIDDGSHNLSDILNSFKTFFMYLKNKGIYVIEDFKFPNYYEYNNDIKDIFVDQMLIKLKNKEYFESKLITKEEQTRLFNQVNSINTYKGKLADSDICFITKN